MIDFVSGCVKLVFFKCVVLKFVFVWVEEKVGWIVE